MEITRGVGARVVFDEITNDDALERVKAFITSEFASGQLKPVIARALRLE